jgi:hypothetical protein
MSGQMSRDTGFTEPVNLIRVAFELGISHLSQLITRMDGRVVEGASLEN